MRLIHTFISTKTRIISLDVKKKKHTATTHPVGGIKYIKKLSVGSPLVFSFECTLKCNVDSLISILLLSLLLSHEILAPNRVWKIKLTVSVTNSSCYRENYTEIQSVQRENYFFFVKNAKKALHKFEC